jgi:glycerophosphoryl diester phosphodiesterase
MEEEENELVMGPHAGGWGHGVLARAGALIVAHRGASHYAPENTLAAFRLALEQGARAVECDVRRTRDKRLVVIHDATVDRTTDGSGLVSALPLDTVRSLDAGRWFGAEHAGERIPLLEEVLTLVRGRALIQVEVKNDPIPTVGIEAQVVDALRGCGLEGDALVMSFDHQSIRIVQSLRSGISTGILYTARLVDPVAAARAAGANALCLNWAYLDRDVVTQASGAGLGLCVWTVDDEAAFKRCQELGVDAVATNDPPLLLRNAAEGGDDPQGPAGRSRGAPARS